MLSLLAAYGDADDNSTQSSTADKDLKPTPAAQKQGKQKRTNGVVKVVLPVHSLPEDDLPSADPIREQQSTNFHAGEKRKASSISDILPSPKSKQSRSNFTFPSRSQPAPQPSPAPIQPTVKPAEEKEEEPEIGPQMPSAADLTWYYEQYQEQPTETPQNSGTTDVIEEIAHCSHIPELERNLIVGKKRRGETPVFVDVQQKELVRVSEWDEESNQYYRTNAALKNTGASYRQSKKNQLSSLVSSAQATSDLLDSRLSRVKQSKAQVRAKYGW